MKSAGRRSRAWLRTSKEIRRRRQPVKLSRACFLSGGLCRCHSAITKPIVKELNPIKLDAQRPHLAVPGKSKLAHGVEPRPLSAVDGGRDSFTRHCGHDVVPASYGFQDTFTGVVHLDYFAIVEVNAQGICLVYSV